MPRSFIRSRKQSRLPSADPSSPTGGVAKKERPLWVLKFWLVATLLTTAFTGCGVETHEQTALLPPDSLAQKTQALTGTSFRHGMSWSVLEQRGAYVFVGADAQTDAYKGDTAADLALPLLCLNKDGRAAPSGITFDFLHGWAAGDVKLTDPIPGSVLTSTNNANAACARAFGSTYRMAEFHDGGGGWHWWAQGTLSAATRFWVGISDQPANPWNSSGDMPPPPYSQTEVSAGVNWKLLNVSGYAVDDSGQPYNKNLYVLQDSEGVNAAPLPAGLQLNLAADVNTSSTVFLVDQKTANEIRLAEAKGSLTPALMEVAEPLDPLPAPAKTGKPSGYKLFGRCSNREIAKNKNFIISTPLTKDFSIGSGFSGNLSATGNAMVNATGEVQFALKRYAIFGFCIPYGVKFETAHAYGTAAVSYGTTLSGTINYANPKPWEYQVAKPHLFALTFSLGPIPVHVEFNLPIVIGLDLKASTTGSVSYTGSQVVSGPFDYTCTLDGCSGSSLFTRTGPLPSKMLSGSIAGRIQPSLYVQAAVRASILKELVYAQIGIRPYLQGDLWGYHGNTCGDADGDGLPETVDALTFDLDWQVFVTAQATAFSDEPRRWNDLWHTARSHLGFWDFVGSTALRPVLSGLTTPLVNFPQQYSASMRPCWPYSDKVNYQLSWGDGSTASLVGLPATPTQLSHSWAALGTKALNLTAQRDAHGRVFNQATARNVQVVNATWTPWLNRDSPDGVGDWETLPEFVAAGLACVNPLAIECQTTTGIDWSKTGQIYSCSAVTGGVCENANQVDGTCLDYQVRFLCP